MKIRTKLLICAFISSCVGFASSLQAQIEIVMKLEGTEIPANFTTKSNLDGYNDGWVTLLGVSSGVATNADVIGGLTAGKADFTDFNIIKNADEITPILSYLSAASKNLTKVTVVWLKLSGSNPVKIMDYELENVVVSSVALSGNDGDDIGNESASFKWAKMTIRSYHVDVNGRPSPSPTTQVVFDRATGRHSQ